MPWARRLVTNPNDVNQYYVLWTNGRVEPRGTNPPMALPTSTDSQYQAGTVPLIPESLDGQLIIQAMQVTNWTSSPPSGYVFDMLGRVRNFGAATAIPDDSQPAILTYPYGEYVDFVMNPNAAEGYALAANGTVINIGGSITIADQQEAIWEEDARRIYMPDFTTRKYMVFDAYGRRWPRNGACFVNAYTPQGQTFQFNDLLYNGEIGEACAFYENFDVNNGHGWALASYGWVTALGDGSAAQYPYGYPDLEGWPLYSDIAIIDNGLGATPLRLRLLDIYGNVNEFFVSTPPTVRVDSPSGTVTNTTRPTTSWFYSDPEGDAQDDVKLRVFNDGTYLSGVTNEVQRVTVTGTPTGGTFKLKFKTQTTQSIVYNATTGQMTTALTSLGAIGSGNVSCSGGALPGTAIDITFVNALGGANQPQITVASKSLTGGSNPNVTTSTVTPGVGFDAFGTLQVPIWEDHIATPRARQVRTDRITTDLDNDTYRVYAVVTDTAGLESPADFKEWTQNVTPPATPTMTITPGLPLNGTTIDLQATHTANAVYVVEYQEGTDPWRYVNGADSLTPDGGGAAQVVDRQATFGVPRSYRTRQLVADPYLIGAYSATQTVTVNSTDWVLTDTDNTNGVVLAVRDFSFNREVVAGTFRPDGRADAVVITAENPVKTMDATLPVRVLDKTAYDSLEEIVTSGHVLQLRDPYGRSHFLVVSGGIKYQQLRARATKAEDYPTRHAHEIDIPITAVSRPLVGPSTGSLALVD